MKRYWVWVLYELPIMPRFDKHQERRRPLGSVDCHSLLPLSAKQPVAAAPYSTLTTKGLSSRCLSRCTAPSHSS